MFQEGGSFLEVIDQVLATTTDVTVLQVDQDTLACLLIETQICNPCS